MGDIKRQRRKYSRPSKPWEKERIVRESSLIKEYGFKNKKELWRTESLLKAFKERAKEFVRGTEEDVKGGQGLIKKLSSLGLIEEGSKLDDVLGLNIKQLLDRRLQTIVFKKSLALSMKQARQLITHGAILVGDKGVTSPSYLVRREEEQLVVINPNSKFANPDHPERVKIKNKLSLKKEEEVKEAENKKEKVVEMKKRKKESKEEKKGKTEEKKKSTENKSSNADNNTQKEQKTKKEEKAEK